MATLCVDEPLTTIQQAFDQVWEAEGGRHVTQHGLLKYRPFIDLIEHQPLLERHRAIFGNQTQLLQYDLLRQGPHSDFPERQCCPFTGWTTFPGQGAPVHSGAAVHSMGSWVYRGVRLDSLDMPHGCASTAWTCRTGARA